MTSVMSTIAVIDDDPRIRETLTSMISASSGHNVLCASDGRSGLSLVCREKPDIVILDIEMPEMNGLQVLESIKENPETFCIPVIMLTGADSPENAEASSYWYADAYLTKSCSRQKLMATICSTLSYRRGSRLTAEAVFAFKGADEKTTFEH